MPDDDGYGKGCGLSLVILALLIAAGYLMAPMVMGILQGGHP